MPFRWDIQKVIEIVCGLMFEVIHSPRQEDIHFCSKKYWISNNISTNALCKQTAPLWESRGSKLKPDKFQQLMLMAKNILWEFGLFSNEACTLDLVTGYYCLEFAHAEALYQPLLYSSNSLSSHQTVSIKPSLTFKWQLDSFWSAATIWLTLLYYAGANPSWQCGVNVTLLHLLPHGP